MKEKVVLIVYSKIKGLKGMKGGIVVSVVLAIVFVSIIVFSSGGFAESVTSNNFKVTWRDCEHGLTQHSCFVDIQNLNPSSARDFNLGLLFNSTNYEITRTEANIKEWKALPTQVDTYNTVLISRTCQRTINNLTNITEDYDCSYNQTTKNGTVTQSIVQWKDTKALLTKTGANLEASYGMINVPKFDSKAKTDDLNNTETLNGTKTFKVEWTTPITKTSSGYGSSGLIAFVDETSGEIYHPWWNTSYTNCKNISIVEANGVARTNKPVTLGAINLSGARSDMADITLVNTGCGNSGTEMRLSTAGALDGYNSPDLYNLTFIVNVTANQNFNWSIYYGSAAHNPTRDIIIWDNFTDTSGAKWINKSTSGGTVTTGGGWATLNAVGNYNFWFTDTANGVYLRSIVNFTISTTKGFTTTTEEVRTSLGGHGHSGGVAAYGPNTDADSSYVGFACNSEAGQYAGWNVGNDGANVNLGSCASDTNVYKNISTRLNATNGVILVNATSTGGFSGSAQWTMSANPDLPRNTIVLFSVVRANTNTQTVKYKNVCAIDRQEYCYEDSLPLTLSVGAAQSGADTTPPTVTIIAPTNTTYTNANITLQVTGNDDIAVDKYWYKLINGANTTFIPNTTFLASVHTNNLTVYINDSSGNIASSQVNFTLNTAPTLASLSMSPAQIWKNTSTIIASVVCTDPEGDVCGITTLAYKNGINIANVTNVSVTSGINNTAVFTFGWTHFDNLSFQANATDGSLASNTLSLTNLTVSDNAPVMKNPSLSPSQIWKNTTTITASAVYDDLESDAGGATFKFYKNGINVLNVTNSAIANSTNTTAVFNVAYVMFDNISFSVNASSNGLASAVVLVSNITVSANIPIMRNPSISPPQIWKNTTTITGSAVYDDVADAIAGGVTFNWFKNGINVENDTISSVANTTNQTAIFNTVYVRFDNISFSVNATVNGQNSAVASVGNITVSDNNPISRNPSITPPAIWLNTTTITGSGIYEDLDTDTGGFSIKWYKNGINVQNCTSSSVANNTNVTCAYTAGLVHFDNLSISVNASSNGLPSVVSSTGNITAGDNNPIMSTVSLSPATALASQTLTCAGVYTDIDLDLGGVTQKWFKNGVNVQNNTFSSVANNTNSTSTYSTYVHFDNISCSTNSTSNGLTSNIVSTGNVTIGDATPVITTVALTPATRYLNETLTASGSFTDADSDTGTLFFMWFKNGINVQNNTNTGVASGANSTATYSTYVHFDNISVRINATSNGLGTGYASNGNLTIGDATPVIVTASLSPSVAFASSTFNASGLYDDIDLDNGGWTCKFYKNGVNVQNTTVSNVANGTNMTCISTFSYSGRDNISVSINASSNGLATNVASTNNITVSANVLLIENLTQGYTGTTYFAINVDVADTDYEVDRVWLSTNESGIWQNFTLDLHRPTIALGNSTGFTSPATCPDGQPVGAIDNGNITRSFDKYYNDSSTFIGNSNSGNATSCSIYNFTMPINTSSAQLLYTRDGSGTLTYLLFNVSSEAWVSTGDSLPPSATTNVVNLNQDFINASTGLIKVAIRLDTPSGGGQMRDIHVSGFLPSYTSATKGRTANTTIHANFLWKNVSIPYGVNISYQIFANTTSGDINFSNVKTFLVDNPPIMVAPSLSPAIVYQGQTLTASAVYTDLDLDAGGVTIKWYQNGINVQNNTFSSVSNSTNLTALSTFGLIRLDNISISANATSNGIASAVSSSGNLTVQNSLPSINSFKLVTTSIDGSPDVRIRLNVTDVAGASFIDKCFYGTTEATASGDFCEINITDALTQSGVVWVNNTANINASWVFNFSAYVGTLGEQTGYAHILGTQRVNRTITIVNNDSTNIISVEINQTTPTGGTLVDGVVQYVISSLATTTTRTSSGVWSGDWLTGETKTQIRLTGYNLSRTNNNTKQWVLNETELNLTNGQAFTFNGVNLSAQCSGVNQPALVNIASGAVRASNNCSTVENVGDWITDINTTEIQYTPMESRANGTVYGFKLINITNTIASPLTAVSFQSQCRSNWVINQTLDVTASMSLVNQSFRCTNTTGVINIANVTQIIPISTLARMNTNTLWYMNFSINNTDTLVAYNAVRAEYMGLSLSAYTNTTPLNMTKNLLVNSLLVDNVNYTIADVVNSTPFANFVVGRIPSSWIQRRCDIDVNMTTNDTKQLDTHIDFNTTKCIDMALFETVDGSLDIIVDNVLQTNTSMAWINTNETSGTLTGIITSNYSFVQGVHTVSIRYYVSEGGLFLPSGGGTGSGGGGGGDDTDTGTTTTCSDFALFIPAQFRPANSSTPLDLKQILKSGEVKEFTFGIENLGSADFKPVFSIVPQADPTILNSEAINSNFVTVNKNWESVSGFGTQTFNLRLALPNNAKTDVVYTGTVAVLCGDKSRSIKVTMIASSQQNTQVISLDNLTTPVYIGNFAVPKFAFLLIAFFGTMFITASTTKGGKSRVDLAVIATILTALFLLI